VALVRSADAVFQDAGRKPRREGMPGNLAHSNENTDGDRRIMDPLLLLLFIAVLALPLILGSRRQKRAMAEAQRLQSSLTEGDRVMTTSGLQGTVVNSADDTTIDLEIAPGVRTTWLRAAIREKITEDDEPTATSSPLTAPIDDSARTDKS
jgi:preprotein translocase subunit YajC